MARRVRIAASARRRRWSNSATKSPNQLSKMVRLVLYSLASWLFAVCPVVVAFEPERLHPRVADSVLGVLCTVDSKSLQAARDAYPVTFLFFAGENDDSDAVSDLVCVCSLTNLQFHCLTQFLPWIALLNSVAEFDCIMPCRSLALVLIDSLYVVDRRARRLLAWPTRCRACTNSSAPSTTNSLKSALLLACFVQIACSIFLVVVYVNARLFARINCLLCSVVRSRFDGATGPAPRVIALSDGGDDDQFTGTVTCCGAFQLRIIIAIHAA